MKVNHIWILSTVWSVQLSCIVAESKETNQSLQKLLSSKEAMMCKKHFMKTSKACESFFSTLKEFTPSTSTSGSKTRDMNMEVPASPSNLNARIVNGEDVLNGSYPWFAKALIGTSPNYSWGGCGAMVCFLFTFAFFYHLQLISYMYTYSLSHQIGYYQQDIALMDLVPMMPSRLEL